MVDPKIVLITGLRSVGKTSISKLYALMLGYKVIHLDQFKFTPDGFFRNSSEFQSVIKTEIENNNKPGIIIEGCYYDHCRDYNYLIFRNYWPSADFVIWLYDKFTQSYLRLIKRSLWSYIGLENNSDPASDGTLYGNFKLLKDNWSNYKINKHILKSQWNYHMSHRGQYMYKIKPQHRDCMLTLLLSRLQIKY